MLRARVMLPPRVSARLYVPLLLAASAALALGAARGDSATIDEPGHLVSVLAVWHEGDFRLSPDHPPLARLWAALPVFLGAHAWQAAGAPGWSDGDWWRFGPWVFERNDPERLLWPARAMMVGLLLATCLATWWVARRLFGPAAGGLALLLAALDPGFLAHGHYVTTDLPMTLAALVCLGTFAGLCREIRLGRLAAAAAALVALSLAKLAWVLALPALGAMALWAWWRPEPPLLALPGLTRRPLPGRARRAAWLLSLGALLALSLWAGVWAAYGFRYAALAGPDAARATMYPASVFGSPRPADMDEAWQMILRDPGTGRPREGLLPALVRGARQHRLLPEAYVYGLALLDRKSLQRVAYLRGEFYSGGRADYFPRVLAWKTPLPTLLLAGMGLAALALGRVRSRDVLLSVGLATFAVVYAAATLGAGLNIGQRHLLPLYPAVFVAAGAAAAWAETRLGRAAVPALAAWLCVSSLAAYPHFLGYFNELAGGWRRGHLLLADSNVDWSQDLVRLRDWTRARPGENVTLLQSGHAPWPRGLTARPLLPSDPLEPLAPLEPGWYVVSTNELLGLFKPYQREATWRDPRLRAGYRALWEGGRFDTAEAGRSFDALRRALLVSRLGARREDERIGTSLFAFRLGQADLELLTRP